MKRRPYDILIDLQKTNNYSNQYTVNKLKEELDKALRHEPLNEYGKWFWGLR